jgi:hypothetical protein
MGPLKNICLQLFTYHQVLKETDLFSESFLSVPNATIVEAIKTDGVFCASAALTEDFLSSIREDVTRTGYGLNRNWITSVYTRDQLFLSHMFAVSRSFVEFSTHPRLFDLFDQILESNYRLKCHRYYETYGGHHMQWHTDNKTDRGFAHIPGLIVIAYVSDVEDGEFQYVRGSQHWSGEKAYSDYTDQFVEQNCSKDILSFKGSRGTVVIYDTYGIHRAKPVKQNTFVRKSLFFQVDSALEASEPLLLNPEYINDLDDRIKRYLGFGQPSGYSIYPQTDLSTMPLSRQREIFRYLVNSMPLSMQGEIIRRLGKKIARVPTKLLPRQIKSTVKSFLRQTSIP